MASFSVRLLHIGSARHSLRREAATMRNNWALAEAAFWVSVGFSKWQRPCGVIPGNRQPRTTTKVLRNQTKRDNSVETTLVMLKISNE